MELIVVASLEDNKVTLMYVLESKLLEESRLK